MVCGSVCPRTGLFCLLHSWPFHITHQILLSVSKRLEKPNKAPIWKGHSDAKLNLRPAVDSCVEPVSDGALGLWWAPGVLLLCPPGLLEGDL